MSPSHQQVIRDFILHGIPPGGPAGHRPSRPRGGLERWSFGYGTFQESNMSQHDPKWCNMFQGSLYQHKGERTSLVQDFGRCWGMFVGPCRSHITHHAIPFFCCSSGAAGETGGGRQWRWRRWRWEFLGQGAEMWDVTMWRIRRNEGMIFDVNRFGENIGIWRDMIWYSQQYSMGLSNNGVRPNTWPFRWRRSWHSIGIAGTMCPIFRQPPRLWITGLDIAIEQLKVMDVHTPIDPHRVLTCFDPFPT